MYLRATQDGVSTLAGLVCRYEPRRLQHVHSAREEATQPRSDFPRPSSSKPCLPPTRLNLHYAPPSLWSRINAISREPEPARRTTIIGLTLILPF